MSGMTVIALVLVKGVVYGLAPVLVVKLVKRAFHA